MAAVTVGGAFLSASLQVLFDKLTSPALYEFGSLWGVEQELNRLRRTMLKVMSVASDTEMREISDRSLKIWLNEIKDVAYDADDILDEFEAEVLRKQVESKNQVSYFSSFNPNQVIFRHDISRKINAIRERLDHVAQDRDDLRPAELEDTRRRFDAIERRESSSLVAKSHVYGREKDAEHIIEILISEDMTQSLDVNAPPVLLIAGMGGIGKTTLAKLVYNDERIDNYFKLKIWVHVSEEFSIRRITKEIAEYSSSGRHRDAANWNMVQENLQEELREKRLLLVLDDLWSEDRYRWEQLCLPLMCVGRGSKILITSRNKNVANITGTTTTYCLECLSDEDCWQIFTRHAFANGICDGHPKLEEIGKEIVQKVKGLPLAAKTLGGLLYSKLDEEDWRNVSESELWELPSNGKDVLSTLKLSYQHLPAHLKQCFAYCSLFPKDYEFDKTKLIQIWMAQGFVQAQGRKRVEDVGSECFDELLSRDFFQQFEESYFMHNMIHGLAQFVSLDECFTARNHELHKIPENARHLSLISYSLKPNVFKDLQRFKCLRSLFLLREGRSALGFISGDLFIKLRYIRVLDLSYNNIIELPESIGNLKLLRYLDLSNNNIEQLPETIGNLHNLQILKLEDCTDLFELPKGMKNLINLRHLKANDELVSSIAGIGNLVKLQELVKFKVHRGGGHGIAELKNMTELQKIHVSDLENVMSKKEAGDAMLNNKRYIRMLTLEWNYNREICSTQGVDENVLEGLQPHPNLKELSIWENAGVQIPSWLRNQFLSNLETIRLRNCKNWEVFPSLGQLQFLRSVEISGMDGVKQIDHHFYGNTTNNFPSLMDLQFVDMPEWEEWSSPEGGQFFPCLQELLLVSCPKLLGLPPLPLTLERLWLRQVGLLSLPGLSGCCETVEGSSSLSQSYLTTLEISGCPKLVSLQDGILQHHLPALESLSIIDCPNLTHSPNKGGFPALVPLRSLTIENCSKLTALLEDRLPSSLAHLKIDGCPDLTIRCLQNLTSLYSLSISNCSNISSLPEEALCNLIALEELIVSSCKELTLLQFQALVSLKRLTVENCPMLTAPSQIPYSSLEYLEISKTPDVAGLLQNLTSLLSLQINSCPQITSFVNEEELLQKLLSLQSLNINDCVNLQLLPESLHRLTSLERLYLQNCPQIQSLPENGLPISLTVLDIRQCPMLEARCEKDGGPDWPKIAHISNLHITITSKSDIISGTDRRVDFVASTSYAARVTELGVHDGIFY